MLFCFFRMTSSAASSLDKRGPISGPVYVPFDSWIYQALEKLAAMGYAPDEEGLTRPWTRSECLVLLEEAQDIASRHSTKLEQEKTNEDAKRLIATLKDEFSNEDSRHAQAGVESAYIRILQISGSPLRDSFHFGQTIVNDYGRPNETGTNAVAGLAGFATVGRFSGYLRTEYLESAGRAAYSRGVQDLLGTLDGVPAQASARSGSTSKLNPLEMYVGVHLGKFDVTFGKQSLWWGPGENSALHFSDNAEPFYAVRIAQQEPFVLPGPLRHLGHIRTQLLVGKLSGHRYPPRPFLNAEKITLQVTPNLELGFTRSAIFGGAGHPLTTGSVFRSFFGMSSTGGTAFGSSTDPGDRRSGFDFLWRIPGLRRLVTIYSDSLADDEPNPLDSPRRSAWAPGIYFTRLPRLPRMDLRFETYSTWLYRGDAGGQFLYWNNQYRDAYTNNGYVLGSWIGRDARAYVASSTYWWSAQNKVAVSFRRTTTGSLFLPGGGTQTDVSINGQWQARKHLTINPFVQFERYLIPALGNGIKKDVSAGLQVTFWPRNLIVSRYSPPAVPRTRRSAESFREGSKCCDELDFQ